MELELPRHDQLGYLITEVYWPFIRQRVTFRHIIPNMKFMRAVQRDVMKAEERGESSEASQKFLDHLKETEEEGKYQAFIDALREHGYEYLVDVLTNDKEIPFSQEEHRQIIQQIYFKEIEQTVDPTTLAQELLAKGIIFEEDAERIRKVHSQSSTLDAVTYLLDAVPRKDENWYPTFLRVLLDYGHEKLVESIDEKFYLQQRPQEDEGLSASSSDLSRRSTDLSDLQANTAVSEERSPPRLTQMMPHDTAQRPSGSDLQERETFSSLVSKIETLDKKVDKLYELMYTINENIKRLCEKPNTD